MPIRCPVIFAVLEPEEFTAWEDQVMSHLFESQNERGRLGEESIYEADARLRLEQAGFSPVRTQAPVTVAFREFRMQ